MAGFLDTIFNWLPKLRKLDGTLAEAQCEADGSLKVAVTTQVSATTTWVDPAVGTPLTYQRLVAALPKKFHGVIGANEGASDRWFMLFDRSSLATNTNEPVFAFKVPAGQFFSLDLRRGKPFVQGIAWAVSSTAGTLTLDAAALFRANVEVE